ERREEPRRPRARRRAHGVDRVDAQDAAHVRDEERSPLEREPRRRREPAPVRGEVLRVEAWLARARDAGGDPRRRVEREDRRRPLDPRTRASVAGAKLRPPSPEKRTSTSTGRDCGSTSRTPSGMTSPTGPSGTSSVAVGSAAGAPPPPPPPPASSAAPSPAPT